MQKRKEWKTPTPESLKAAYENRGKYQGQSNRKFIFTPIGDSKLWKVEDKSHKIRILPSLPDDNINFYGLTVHIHMNVGVNGDQYLCLKRMKSLACPICEHQATLWDTDPEMAKELYPQMRYLVWVVDLSAEKDKQTPKIWSCPRTAMDDILGVSYKKATDEILNLASLEDGIAVYFDREKTAGTTFSKYKNFQLDDSPSPIKEKWLEEIVSFSELLDMPTYDGVKNAFFGLDSEEKEEVVSEKKEEVIQEEKETQDSVDDLDREKLEELANDVLSEDYEKEEIEEMGTKKLRRLVKEMVGSDEKKETEEEVEGGNTEDPKEVLRKKLRDRINK